MGASYIPLKGYPLMIFLPISKTFPIALENCDCSICEFIGLSAMWLSKCGSTSQLKQEASWGELHSPLLPDCPFPLFLGKTPLSSFSLRDTSSPSCLLTIGSDGQFISNLEMTFSFSKAAESSNSLRRVKLFALYPSGQHWKGKQTTTKSNFCIKLKLD